MLPETTPAAGAVPAHNIWLPILGIVFIVVWIGSAVVLFYIFGGGGIVADVLLAIVRSVMFPGTANQSRPEMLDWIPSMRIGMILAGAAGIPAGLAIFWQSWRKSLLLGFTAAFLAGVLVLLYSLYTLLSSAFSG